MSASTVYSLSVSISLVLQAARGFGGIENKKVCGKEPGLANFGLIVHFLDVALHISAQAYTFYFTYVFSGRAVVQTLVLCECDDSASPRQDSRGQESRRALVRLDLHIATRRKTKRTASKAKSSDLTLSQYLCIQSRSWCGGLVSPAVRRLSSLDISTRCHRESRQEKDR